MMLPHLQVLVHRWSVVGLLVIPQNYQEVAAISFI